MNTLSRFHASTLLQLLLLFVGDALGWQVLLLAQDACPPQWDFRASCPYLAAFDSNEPNSPAHAANRTIPLLTPVASTDPNLDPSDGSVWVRAVGRWYREAPVCLPVPGWSLDAVACRDGTSVPTVTFDAAQMVWGLATIVQEGPNWWAIEARSRNVADPRLTRSRVVFVVCYGYVEDGAAGPILAWICPWREIG